MPYPQDALATFIAAPSGGWEPQRQGMGVVMLYPPSSVAADTTTLMLAVKSATLPAREMGAESIKFLAGYSFVPTKPDEPAQFTLTVHDYVDIKVYDMLHRWGQVVFNQQTGFIGMARVIKGSGIFLQFSPSLNPTPAPVVVRRWELVGIWPKTILPERTLDYENNTPVQLNYNFVVDDYIYLGS